MKPEVQQEYDAAQGPKHQRLASALRPLQCAHIVAYGTDGVLE
eukprot:CAMPEP_0174379170 /NCGR_PEP_ID=MMETSP0811_2-20130205/122519_1 /TAXON_ID=73025 ORGANISM="Eutreptiella gymnastica-like, Strain CCMP1594" /NCGR_SAMPLE_ID=MMETSP0811_2 /ASSEMBLY_ACC=CAM_ASM_000667 /LENGTH=42 /DNA_ID= /DNA_START= /DNA_END= /DNA_ORIENTATION=